MSRIRSAYGYIQHMSIDVVLGALSTGLMAASLLQVSLPVAWWIAFPLSVWVFYTGDHLIDAYRLGQQAHTVRHQFHVQYFMPLSLLVGISCLLIVYAILIAPTSLIYLGLIIGGMGVIHLVLSFLLRNIVSRWVQKELGVALIYTLGVWGGPVALTDGQIPLSYWGICFQFFLLAMVNLLIFSYQDLESDILDGHTSMVRAFGNTAVYRIVSICLVGVVLLGIGHILTSDLPFNWLFAYEISLGIGVIFSIIHRFPTWFHTHNRYRVWGDGAFLLSGAYLLISGFSGG